MNTDLEKYLLEFKKLTLEMIESIKKEDFDLLEKLIDKRQNTIKCIEEITYTKEEFKSISEKLNILTEDKNLSKLLCEKKDAIKKQMAEINMAKKASNKYNKHVYQNNGIFSTKI